MIFYGNDHAQINMLFIFFSPVFYLVPLFFPAILAARPCTLPAGRWLRVLGMLQLSSS